MQGFITRGVGHKSAVYLVVYSAAMGLTIEHGPSMYEAEYCNSTVRGLQGRGDLVDLVPGRTTSSRHVPIWKTT